MKKRALCLLLTILMICTLLPVSAFAKYVDIGLKDAYDGCFKIGARVTANEMNSTDTREFILKHFNSVTCANELLPDATIDQTACQNKGSNTNTQVYLSSGAKKILSFCEDNKIPVRGSCFVWHAQTPDWFFREDFSSNGPYVSENIMNQRLESYIKNLFALIANEFPKLEIYAWDVVNEVFTDSDPATMLDASVSNWVAVYSDNEFIYKAFEYAQKYKPEGCMLCYNDCREYTAEKLKVISALCKDLYEKNLLDAIGLESVLIVDYPTVENYRKAIKTYASIGCPIMITQLGARDLNNDPEKQAEYYGKLFEIYLEYKNSIEAVVFNSTCDSQSWFSEDKPLLFDNNYKPKAAYGAVMDAAANATSVSAVSVSVAAPEEGKSPDYTAKLPKNANYSCSANTDGAIKNGVKWTCADDNRSLLPTDKFEVGKKYKVTVSLTSNNGCKFDYTNASAKLNGKSASVSRKGDMLEVTYTFAALKHDYKAVVTAPTCTEKGYTTYTCSKCGYSYKDNYASALDHYYNDGVCTRCGAKDPDYKPPVKTNPFVDVSKDANYYDAILWAYYHEPEQITTGVDATHFAPQNPCTRGQVVTFLWRAAGCPEPSGDTSVFKDSADIAAPFQKAVAWAVEKGITTGFNDGTFRPNDTVTRAQFVTFLFRYENEPATNGSISGFKDAESIAQPFQNAVAWAVEKGITTGFNDGTFRPNDTCTRWAVALFMYRALK